MSGFSLCDELVSCDFGDKRLSDRLKLLVTAFENNPQRSIPSIFKTRAEWEACYRFFDNTSVTPKAILEPHIEATHSRIEDQDVALFVQDTTELNLTRPREQVEGAGYLDCQSRRGAYFHPLMVFSTNGTPLGFADQQLWVREKLSDKCLKEKKAERRAKPIEEKESFRWLEGLRSTHEAALACPETKCVCISDSESDAYELFALAWELQKDCENLHLLIRAGQSRRTSEDVHWKELARNAPLIATQVIDIRERDAKIGDGKSARSRSRKARQAIIEIHATKVEILRPKDTPSKLPEKLTLNVVLCEEVNPPDGEDPICWLLVTTLPIETEEQIRDVIKYYCIRWQIEVFFRTLKSGCRIEYRRFEHIDRVVNCLAILSMIAWRVMYLCYMGRTCPDMDCELIFEPSEWKSVYAVLRKPIPKTGCPKLNEVIRAIAQLGGFIDRPKNVPGTQSIWTGIQRCYDLSNAWIAFGPESKFFLRE